MISLLKKPIANNSGQASVEYMLVLVVSVGIILGALYQMNTAFRVWADNYFGDYLACLIESGELPALGAQVQQQEGGCNSLFKEFSLADGRAPIHKFGPSSGGLSSEGGQGGSVSPPVRATESSGGYDDGAEGSSSTGVGTATRSGREDLSLSGPGSSKRFRISRRAGSKEDESAYTGSSSATEISGYDSSGANVVRIPIRRGTGYQRRTGDDEAQDREAIKVSGSISSEAEKNDAQYIKMNRKVAAVAVEEEDSGFSFGKLFRYILIAAIIIAIVIFIGGQALQVTKSME